ncbi:hypothetical protein KIN20_012717 [Parelaphostrongylus tenuis]|uniref:Uncharacterized protein n=1 Tax=Parelaphostrongylus tenuis TaxID=148309 RepID=A0AAD5MTP8_PARTN|nr:hypothetical protein KIN20_012717 [Parelaphostrongylus tenuis]
MALTEEDKSVFTNIDQASKSGKKLTVKDIYQKKKSQLKHASTAQQRIVTVCDYRSSLVRRPLSDCAQRSHTGIERTQFLLFIWNFSVSKIFKTSTVCCNREKFNSRRQFAAPRLLFLHSYCGLIVMQLCHIVAPHD